MSAPGILHGAYGIGAATVTGIWCGDERLLMKRAQMEWRYTIILYARRGDHPPPPRRLFLRASTMGRHPPPPGKVNNVYHGLVFHGMRRCLLYFSTAKSYHFITSWAKKLADKPSLNKYTEAVLSRGSCMHSLFDTGLNTYCYLSDIPE